MSKNTTENSQKTRAACGKAKAPAPEKLLKKDAKADSKPPKKGAKK